MPKVQRTQNAHARMIDELLVRFPGARRSGFSRALNAIEFLDAVKEHERWEAGYGPSDDEPAPTLEDRRNICLGPAGVVPDAFFVDFETQCIFAFEVEDTYHVTQDKLDRYFDPWFRLDYIYWDLVVIGVNRWGGAALIDVSIPIEPSDKDASEFYTHDQRLEDHRHITVPRYRFARIHTELDQAERERLRTEFLAGHPHFRGSDFWRRSDIQKRFQSLVRRDIE